VADVRTACERGLAFVETSGSDLDVWLARALLANSPPKESELPEPVIRCSEAYADSGTSPLHRSDLDDTLRVVGALDDARGLHLDPARSICVGLESSQATDGSWGSVECGEDARIFATGMLAGHFAKTRYARASMLDCAAEFLAARFTPDRVQGGAWDGIAAYSHLFANFPHEEADAILQWTGRELERGFRSGRFDAVRTARVIVYCDAPSVPGARLGATEVREQLIGEQQADGGWLSLADPSPEARVRHTCDALAALNRLG